MKLQRLDTRSAYKRLRNDDDNDLYCPYSIANDECGAWCVQFERRDGSKDDGTCVICLHCTDTTIHGVEEVSL